MTPFKTLLTPCNIRDWGALEPSKAQLPPWDHNNGCSLNQFVCVHYSLCTCSQNTDGQNGDKDFSSTHLCKFKRDVHVHKHHLPLVYKQTHTSIPQSNEFSSHTRKFEFAAAGVTVMLCTEVPNSVIAQVSRTKDHVMWSVHTRGEMTWKHEENTRSMSIFIVMKQLYHNN